jgi:FixJ family two-component response regulator
VKEIAENPVRSDSDIPAITQKLSNQDALGRSFPQLANQGLYEDLTMRFKCAEVQEMILGRDDSMTLSRAPFEIYVPSPNDNFAPIVFIVDDDVSVRESLEPLIRCAGWHPVAFASAQEFLSHLRPRVPSCLVLDVALPDLSGLELQKCIAADRFELPIIFISGQCDVPTTVKAMKAGAQEFLTKPINDELLLSAIHNAIEQSLTALRRESEIQGLRRRYASLTARERQVMALVAAGLLNKQVGGELGISEITVKAHRGKVMEKMNARSLPDLVKMAARLRRPAPLRANTVQRASDLCIDWGHSLLAGSV